MVCVLNFLFGMVEDRCFAYSVSNDDDGENMMEYVQLGHTDLRVSRLCQGTAFRHLPRTDDPRAMRVLASALD